ncbi:MAG: plasmid pRiA4b ORF-3 family protein [Cytophagales bacterium]|nr:plasmid pRiA4b ORF-3 family protein [Cytophagales bacterium]
MPHSVYRRILVPSETSLLQLHFIIQLSMGWKFEHLFQFQDRRAEPNLVAGIPDDFDEDDFSPFGRRTRKQPADEVALERFAVSGLKSFWYWYDFGDDWWHKINFQKVSKKDMAGYNGKIQCVEAVGQCPPEDIGGPWGYDNWLRIITLTRTTLTTLNQRNGLDPTRAV